MIISTKNYTKKNKQKIPDSQYHRRNSISKAVHTKSHKESCTYILTKREKGKKNIFFFKKGREQPNQ